MECSIVCIYNNSVLFKLLHLLQRLRFRRPFLPHYVQIYFGVSVAQPPCGRYEVRYPYGAKPPHNNFPYTFSELDANMIGAKRPGKCTALTSHSDTSTQSIING